MSIAPGTEAIASTSTGPETSAPTVFSSRCRSWWISGTSGGTASIVRRVATPPSQSSSSRTQSARVSLKRSSRYGRYLVLMAGLLIVTPAGTEVAIALAGDAAELVKPDVIANVVGLGVPPLRDLLDKCLEQDVAIYV